MPKGGKRPGAGKPKGYKHEATISKEQAREAFRVVVQRHMQRMLQAQIANACGIMHLMLRNPDGTWAKATTDKQIEAALNGDPSLYWIATKDPSIQAFTDLANRALDKPKEQEATLNVNMDTELISLLIEGRKRAAAARKG